MVKCFIDELQEYKDELLVHLRAHNYEYTDDKLKESKYIYAYKDNQLVGSIRTSYSWAWLGYGSIYYENTDVLKALIAESVRLYKGKVEGYKMFSVVAERIQDYKSIGFVEVGQVPGLKGYRNRYYLDLINHDISPEIEYHIEAYEQEKEEHKEFLQTYTQTFDTENNLNRLDEVMYICLDKDVFCGGVHFEIYEDLVHTHLLAVNKEYKGNNIGTILMNYVEDYAKGIGKKLLTVGTTEFQARPFYEKLGYKVVYTRQNHPRGFECYTLYKTLEE